MLANYACPITIKWYHYAMRTAIVFILMQDNAEVETFLLLELPF